MPPVPAAPDGWTAVRVGDEVFFWPSSQPIPTSLDGSHGFSGMPNFRIPSGWDKQPPAEWRDLYGAANRGKGVDPFEVLATTPAPAPPAAPAAPATPGPAPQAPPFVRTGEQESGAVAKAIKEVNEKADKAQTQLASADAALMKAILGAHTRTEEGRAELSKIQKEWMALSSKVDLTSPAGSKQMFYMMDNRMADINRILNSNVLDNASSAGIIAAKKALYAKIEADGTAGADQTNPQGGNQNPEGVAGGGGGVAGGGGTPDAPGGQPGAAGAAQGEPQGEPVPPAPNLGGVGAADPLSGLMNAAAQVPGALGGALGAPLNSLGGFGSALGSALGPAFAQQQPESPDPYRDDSPGTRNPNDTDEPDDPHDPKKEEPEPKKDEPAPPPEPQPGAQPPAPAPPSDVVTDNDGKTTKAASIGLAKALDNVRNQGMDIPTGYREAGFTVPPVTATIPPEQNVPPSQIMGGDLANTGTRWVSVWDRNTVLMDGQLRPISDLPNNGEMKGYWRPPETSGATISTAAHAAAPAQPASGPTSSPATGK